MGRLQKKKDPQKKKTKKTALTAESSTPMTAGDAGTAKKTPAAFKKAPVGVKRIPEKKKDNFLDKAMQFLREVKVEMKKVTWPSRKQTIGSTVVVIILVFIIAFFLGIVDFGLSGVVRVVLQ